MFGRKTIAIGNEPKMTLKVGHDRYNNLIIKELRNKGSLVVFPSYLWHTVHPVTSGRRLSLVLWSSGAPFR